MKNSSRKKLYLLKLSLAISLLIVGVIFVSYPGWYGEFILDDYPNIVKNAALQPLNLNINSLWTAIMSGHSGILGRPVSMFSFAINSLLHGINPFYFKLTNTIIHIINSLLVFFISIKLFKLNKLQKLLKLNITVKEQNQTRVITLSFLISLIWALSPININSSLYVVQRMNELSFLFIISACLLFIDVRTKPTSSVYQQLVSFFILLLLLGMAIFSKENGILLIPLLLTLELFIIAGDEKNNALFYKLILFFLIALPITYIGFYLLNSSGHSISYVARDFTLIERVLTQLRVLVFYTQQLLIPDIYLLTYYHDDFPKSLSMFQPVTTLYSLIFWLVSVIISLLSYKKYPWLLFGLSWFFVAHSIESSIIPLEMIYEHRNYLPSFGIIFLSISSLYYLYIQNIQKNLKIVFICISIIYILALTYYAKLSSQIISQPFLMYKTYVENHPNSIRSQVAWGNLNMERYFKTLNPIYRLEAEKSFQQIQNLNPNRISAYTNQILIKHYHHENFDNILNQLYNILKNSKITPEVINDTSNFISANQQLPKPIKQSIINQYFINLLENSSLEGKYKGIIHKEYADYLSLYHGLSKEVVQHYRLLVRYYPITQTKLLLISKLIDAKQYTEARIKINRIDKSYKKGQYGSVIKKLIKILNEKTIANEDPTRYIHNHSSQK